MSGKFYVINVLEQAEQIGAGVVVHTPEGEITTRANDWICENPEGDMFILRGDLFGLIAVEL